MELQSLIVIKKEIHRLTTAVKILVMQHKDKSSDAHKNEIDVMFFPLCSPVEILMFIKSMPYLIWNTAATKHLNKNKNKNTFLYVN